MATKTFTPLLGKRLRVTRLDECGNVPPPGTPESQLVTSGFITVSLSSEVEDGVEIITKRADGALCVNERFSSSFKRFNVEATFCGVNPSLLAFTSNAEEYRAAADVIGITVPEGDIDKVFSFELWTGVAGGGCVAGAGFNGGYLLLPLVGAGTLGDLEVTGEDAVTFSVTGAFTRGGNSWGVGPLPVLGTEAAPTKLPTPLDPLDHLLLIQTSLEPPESDPSPIDMPGVPEPPAAVAAGTAKTG